MRNEIIDHALRRGDQPDADSATVAAAIVGAVRLLLGELKPLVGEQATGALYRRSLHLARSSFQRPPDTPASHDELLAPLQLELASRPPPAARQAGRALLDALVDLLASLIGESLTHRLLMKAWETDFDASVSKENPR